MWDLGQLWEGLPNNFMGLEESFSAVPERIRLSSLCSCLAVGGWLPWPPESPLAWTEISRLMFVPLPLELG